MWLLSHLNPFGFIGGWDLSRAILTLCAITVLSRVFKYVNGLRVVNNWPGIRCAFSPLGFPGAVIPSSRWNPGILYTWRNRFDLYRKYSNETISIVPFISGRADLITSNLDVARQLVAGGIKSDWIRPESASGALLQWGMNVFGAEKETWLRHRRILSPAFTVKTYHMVWDQTIAAYHEMVAHEGWSAKDVVDVPKIAVYTTNLALLVICTCGFGIPSSWSSPSTVKGADGSETMSVTEALRVETELALIADLLPAWAKSLPLESMRKVKASHELLTTYMTEQAASRRAEVRTQLAMGEESGRDIFSLLARANELEAQSNKLTLSDQEMIGNVFLLLIAGHETTAHTLAATFALLAVHQDIQEELYQEIIDVVGPDGDPKFEDYHRLDKVLAAFYEASRMFPAVYIMIREAIKDTTLIIPGPVGQPENTILPIRQGTWMSVDMVGLQYNPRYFPDAHLFKPSRWYSNGDGEGASDKADAITSFSFGPRNCIGRRFATTEVVAFLAMWLRDWAVEPLLRPGETVAQWEGRVLDAQVFLTLDIKDVPVRLQRRKV